MARVIEASGISTVTLNMFDDVIDLVKMPRTIKTNFVFGAPFGNPHNRNVQQEVIKTCLKTLETATKPGTVVKVPYKWREEI